MLKAECIQSPYSCLEIYEGAKFKPLKRRLMKLSFDSIAESGAQESKRV